MTAKKKVIELIRVSTESQAADDRASIPAQRHVNRQTCAAYGLEIVRTIQITDVSGASVLESPEMRQLLELIKSPEVNGVVVREFSRLMRPEDPTDYRLLKLFADSNATLYLPEGPIDPANKMGKLMGIIRAAFAGLERSEIKERTWSAKEEKRRRGELGQNEIVLPFGVGYADGHFFYKPESERVRQAFRKFLSGQQSYSQLAKMVGVTPRGMHLIMRNPIWTGWRIIDKKRDPSSSGLYPTRNGRQGDRRKIARSPDEVIRVKVIDKPLVSQEDFDAVQQIMNRKQKKHWRAQGRESRFTYSGFLTCSECGAVVHTVLARRDYYACKGRRTMHVCKTKYMGRQKLESQLDDLFATSLTDPAFLEKCVAAVLERQNQPTLRANIDQLKTQIEKQEGKRKRVLDLCVDGVLDKQEREERLAVIESELRNAKDLLAQAGPAPELDLHRLTELLSPLAEWKFWSRDQKRAVLSTLMPDIRVADCAVQSLGFNPVAFSNENTRMGRDSWRLSV
jgi:DNA invertase Pin-like site-specific DNA recombinase